MSFAPILALIVLAAGVAASRLMRVPHWAIQIGVGVGTLLVGAMATSSGYDPVAMGITSAAGLIAAVCLPRNGAPWSQYAVVVACAGAIGLVMTLNPPVLTGALVDQPRFFMGMLAGVALAVGVGFVLRAASAEHVRHASTLWFISCGVVVVSVRRLCAQGPGNWLVNLPTVDPQGEAAFWLVDFGQGVPITMPVSGVAELALFSAAIMAIASLEPIPARLRGFAGIAGGIGALGAAMWLLSLQGAAAEIDKETVLSFLKPIAVKGALEGGPRPLSAGPYVYAAHLSAIPIICMAAAGFASTAAGLARAFRPAPGPVGLADLAAALKSRDLLQWGVLCAGLGLTLSLFANSMVTGVWGPASPSEHLLSGAVLASGACLLASHAIGNRLGLGWNWLRSALIAIIAIVLVGTITGGMVSTLGAFEL